MINKRGQTQISFGTIFSIILIIIFIVFAVYGISKFLTTVNFAKIEKFKNDFQTDIDSMWQNQRGSQQVEYALPRKITAVCFRDNEDSGAEMYFEPFKLKYETKRLKHIDIKETLDRLDSSSCISTYEGTIALVVEKYENLVIIKRTAS